LIDFPNNSLDTPAVLGNTAGGRRDALKRETDVKAIYGKSNYLNVSVPKHQKPFFQGESTFRPCVG